MEQYFQAVAAVLLAVILVLVLKNGNRGIGELLSLLVCGMVITIAVGYIQPVVEFIRTVQNLAGLDSGMLKLLLKAVGISVTAEIAALLCDDSGSSAMGKTLQFLATAVIMCLSIPMLTELLGLIEGILGGL